MGFSATNGNLPDNTTITLTAGGRLQALGGVPIGTVLTWDKTFTNTPALPANYKESDGSVVNEPLSVYNGQTSRTLNGGRRFLAGFTSSGGTGTEDLLVAHTHDFTHTHSNPVSNSFLGGVMRMFTDSPNTTSVITTTQSSSTTSSASAGTAFNYTNMVMIVRIY